MTDVAAYKADLERYSAELASLKKKREELDVERSQLGKRIEQLKQVVSDLAALCGQGDIGTLGFTAAVRKVLERSGEYMTPADVRAALSDGGYDLTKYNDPICSITTILKRLSEKEEAEAQASGGRFLYRWKAGDSTTDK